MNNDKYYFFSSKIMKFFNTDYSKYANYLPREINRNKLNRNYPLKKSLNKPNKNNYKKRGLIFKE